MIDGPNIHLDAGRAGQMYPHVAHPLPQVCINSMSPVSSPAQLRSLGAVFAAISTSVLRA